MLPKDFLGIVVENILDLPPRQFGQFSRMLHTQELLIDGHYRTLIAVNLGLLGIVWCLKLIPKPAHRNILAMKTVGDEIVASKKDSSVVFVLEQRVMSHQV